MLLYPLLVLGASARTTVLFESGPVRPVTLDREGPLRVADLPDGRLEQLDLRTGAVTAPFPSDPTRSPSGSETTGPG